MERPDLNKICLTCLRSESLNPIFREGDDHERCSTAIFMTTGIKVEKNDRLPHNMCTQCMTELNNLLKFRKLSKDSEMQLLECKRKIKQEGGFFDFDFKVPKQEVDETATEAVYIKQELVDVPSSDEDNKPLKELKKD